MVNINAIIVLFLITYITSGDGALVSTKNEGLGLSSMDNPNPNKYKYRLSQSFPLKMNPNCYLMFIKNELWIVIKPRMISDESTKVMDSNNPSIDENNKELWIMGGFDENYRTNSQSSINHINNQEVGKKINGYYNNIDNTTFNPDYYNHLTNMGHRIGEVDLNLELGNGKININSNQIPTSNNIKANSEHPNNKLKDITTGSYIWKYMKLFCSKIKDSIKLGLDRLMGLGSSKQTSHNVNKEHEVQMGDTFCEHVCKSENYRIMGVSNA